MAITWDKYKYYTGKNEVVAVSTYAGKTVRGIAKCHEDDEFDLANGQRLAAARCHEKIAKKRQARAARKLTEATKQVTEAVKHYNKMVDYYTDATEDFGIAQEEVKTLLSKM